MSRVGKARLKLFVEGDTEENYFSGLRTKNNIEIVYKEVNLNGGGYTSFLKEIKKSSEYGFVAFFIVIDLDRYIDDPNQSETFKKLLEYCNSKNKTGRIPYFLIATNKDFEFFACCHCPKYNDGDTSSYITKKFNYSSVDEFKSDKKVYEFLNRNTRSYKSAINKIRDRKTYISNIFRRDNKGLDVNIRISKTVINPEALTYYHSNVFELFDIIGVEI